MILSNLDIIVFDRGGTFGTAIIAVVFGFLYHKYKPMTIKELIKLILNKI